MAFRCSNLATATALIGLLVGPWDPSALAAQRCSKPCKEITAACKRERCTALADATRRRCIETCRGMGGCSAIRTLAYVVSECRTDARGFVGRQEIRIRRGNCAPITVRSAETREPVPDPAGLCRLFGEQRSGSASRLAGVFHRFAVSPDARLLVFEQTVEHALFRFTTLAPDEEGLFVIRSDGTDLRRLGPPSQVREYRLYETTVPPYIGFSARAGSMDFSPDSRILVLTDLGPGSDGRDGVQLVSIDLATGERRQITRLVDGLPLDPSHAPTFQPRFIDHDNIVFVSYSNPDGLNPGGKLAFFTVDRRGERLRAFSLFEPVGAPLVAPDFEVTGRGTTLVTLGREGVPENVGEGLPDVIHEVFVFDGETFLQLTNFRRADTTGKFLSRDGRTAFFAASADPFGKNPSHNCQLFSLDKLGDHLRQLTFFREGDRSVNGCDNGPPPGCTIGSTFEDPVTGTIVMSSTCNPLGTNPYAEQVFALRGDGSRLRQLTVTRGFVAHPDGAVSVEMAGPVSYSGPRR